MIEGLAGQIAGVFENPAVSTLVGFLPDIADRIRNARHHFVKSRRLDALVREYAYIAEAMGCPTLARVLRTQGIIDELDASCDGSMSKKSLAEQMLSNASIPEAERAAEKLCLQFVGDYFDAKNWVADEKLEAATALNGKRIASGVEAVGEKLSQLHRDMSERDNNTALILNQMIAGNLTYEQAREHVRYHGRDDRSSRLMGLYCDVLSGDGLDESSLSEAGPFRILRHSSRGAWPRHGGSTTSPGWPLWQAMACEGI